MTVLFADVVHSMDIAAEVGAERLREIMTDLVNRAAVVVQRYGGTVGSFTGDGIMAVFGAPVALEDHAVRACLAGLGVQDEAKRLAVDVQDRDGVELQLRIGLNSGQVIAGEIGSGSFGYTAIGDQVGMAQRMESVAAPGGVILSASTARLVDGAVALGEPEMVQIKGANEPVEAYLLLSIGEKRRGVGRAESTLVGRRWEMSAVDDLLQRAIEGHGAVVGVVGPPGIGKSRLVREVSAMAGSRGVQVFTAFCESHTSQVPFHAVARLLRAATGVEGLDGQAARDRVRDRVPDADPEDFALADDLLGIADPNTPLPPIDPDARRRRLTALVNAASLARKSPAVYVVEDAHWIDEVSESMIADFLSVIPQTAGLVLVTYRPEYRGALAHVGGAQSIALAPLSDSETAALVSQLLGADSSVGGVATMIAEKAAGNPFFTEEIVRDPRDQLYEPCVGEVRTLHVRQVRAAQVGAVEVRPGQLRVLQVCAGQVREGQVRVGQVRGDQRRARQVRGGQVCAEQVREDQARAGQVRAGQDRALQCRYIQPRAEQAGTGQVREVQVHVGQVGALAGRDSRGSGVIHDRAAVDCLVGARRWKQNHRPSDRQCHRDEPHTKSACPHSRSRGHRSSLPPTDSGKSNKRYMDTAGTCCKALNRPATGGIGRPRAVVLIRSRPPRRLRGRPSRVDFANSLACGPQQPTV